MIRIDCQSQNEMAIIAHILEDHPLIEYEVWLIHPITREHSHSHLPVPDAVPVTRDWRDMHYWRKEGITGTGRWQDHPAFFNRLPDTVRDVSPAEALELIARFRKAYPELEELMRRGED